MIKNVHTYSVHCHMYMYNFSGIILGGNTKLIKIDDIDNGVISKEQVGCILCDWICNF